MLSVINEHLMLSVVILNVMASRNQRNDTQQIGLYCDTPDKHKCHYDETGTKNTVAYFA
jgi:hypothetical protein